MKKTALALLSLALLGACEGKKATELQAENTPAIRGGVDVSFEDSIARKVFRLRIKFNKTQVSSSEGSPLTKWEVSHCTASALTPRILLTAAHCFPETTDKLNVELTLTDGTQELVAAIAHKKHRFYTEADRSADIAMVLLETSLPSQIELVHLPPKDEDLQLTQVIAAGYGVTGTLDSPSGGGVLRKTVLNVAAYDPFDEKLTVDQGGGTGACKGDSGGSALIEKDGITYTVGVFSYVDYIVLDGQNEDEVEKCAHLGHYTNVQFHLDWIRSVLKHWEHE